MIGGKWSKQDCGLSEKTIYFRLLSIDAKGFQGKQEKIMFNSWLRCIMSDGLLSVCERRTSSVYRNIEEEKDGRSEAVSLTKMEKKRGPSIEPCGTPERTRRDVDSWCPTRKV